MMGNEALVQKLVQSVRLFNGFSQEEALTFLSACKLETHPTGTRLIRQGEVGYKMYIVLSGEVVVKRESGTTELELARLGPGDTFGELSLLDFGTRSASIDVISETRAFVTERAAMLRLSSLEAKLYRNLAMMMATRLRETDAIISQLGDHAETQPAYEQLTSSTHRHFVG